MNNRYSRTALVLLSALLSFSFAAADSRRDENNPNVLLVDSHAGQRDTDGILSPGEIPNPNIDYDRSQRNAERRGDARVDNPENDAAASADRADDRENRYDRERDRNDRERGEGDWRHRDDSRRARDERSSWWHFW